MSDTSISFDQKTYNSIKKILTDVIKKIENYETRPLCPYNAAEREERVNRYKRELIGSYNVFVQYCEKLYDTFDEGSQLQINELITHLKVKVKNALSILGLEALVPDETLEFINVDSVVVKQNEAENLNSQLPEAPPSPKSSENRGENSEIAEQSGSGITSPIQQNLSQITLQDLGDNSQNSDGDSIPEQNIQNMALSPGDILRGIPDFDSKTQTDVNKFIACVDMMYVLSPNANDTILAVLKAKLVAANKLGSLENKTWPQIKNEIHEKYKLTVPFEVAQEQLISIKQGPKETLDAYANRVKSLLDSLNNATLDANNEVQASNRVMNENLATRKFKQNIFDKEIRIMAISAEHTSLTDAIAHAMAKSEQLHASNVAIQPQIEKKDANSNKSGNGGNSNKQFNTQNKNEKSTPKSNEFCKYCKRNNHTIETCRALARKNSAKPNSEKSEKQTQSSTAVASKQPDQQMQNEQAAGSSTHLDIQSLTLQPYHHLNY